MKSRKIKGLICLGLAFGVTCGFSAPVFANGTDVKVSSESEAKVSSYESIREQWIVELTGNSPDGSVDSDIAVNIEQVDLLVDKAVADFSINEEKKIIWEAKLDTKSVSATMTAHLKELYNMALSYKTNGSRYHGNKEVLDMTIQGIEFIHRHYFNADRVETPNNWWDWEIGSPRQMANMMILLHDELVALESSDINNFGMDDLIKAMDRFVPDATKRLIGAVGLEETGTNRIDKALIVALRAICDANPDKSAERLSHSSDAVSNVFKNVEKGDGFYEDGSFVYHGNIAYTGSYGLVLISALSDILLILQQTDYGVPVEEYSIIYEWIEKSFEPFVTYGGNFVDSLRGRAISRMGEQGYTRGRYMVTSMLKLADIAPNEKIKSDILELSKNIIEEGSASIDNYFVGLRNSQIKRMKDTLKNNTIAEYEREDYYHQFHYMDRAISNREDYHFSVSMSSDRIANFEAGNQENLKGWYTGQGMTYLYNNDVEQFGDNFFATVDSYRLPGVTSDGQTRFTGRSNNKGAAFAGGTSVDNENGISGMEINPEFEIGIRDSKDNIVAGEASGMSARKSWFMFEDEIVAVGSNISSPTREVETIIENRKIKQDGSNRVIAGGENVVSDLNTNISSEADWVHLEGNVEDSDIGYVMLDDSKFEIKKESRTGTWADVNAKAQFADYEERTENYVSLAVNHGDKPSLETYAYAIIPNAEVDDLEEFKEEDEIRVIVNNENVHGVYNEDEDILAFNIFEGTEIIDGISTSGETSIMLKEDDGRIEVSVSNPTRKLDNLEINFDNVKFKNSKFEGSENVIAKENGKGMTISINTSKKSGESYKFSFKGKLKQIVKGLK